MSLFLSRSPSTVRAVRQSTGAVGTGASVQVVCTFPSPFDSANYTAVASVELSGSADLTVAKIVARDAASVTVLVSNSALTSRTGVVHVVAVPD